MTKQQALIIGASRGIGLGLVERLLERDWEVTATSRRAADHGLADLADRFAGRLQPEQVDIDSEDQVTALHQRLAGSAFDLILINAGVTHDRWETVAEVSTDTFQRLMLTNALSPMRFIERFQDRTTPSGTLAVTSSGQGSITNNTRVTGWEVYRASKSALNQLMRSFAARHPDDSHTLLLLAPGWVRTELGGPEATLSVEQSTAGLADVIEAQAGRRGLQFLDQAGRTVPW
ncbi:SDR family NAD(P)-dependent oxidoreductase [Microlunatus soli]|uniref:NAD(P)-dependent dehydrogenase, short-chain alcohol dehydrogenase family n=1 Tax=Microlunatus soli TaxID=630515 RepID=A0A1H1ZIZ5_9ACTN|nr:SDR family NAD(P)-dependent oxidoreductase [Microlunatus soli]SDT33688.1 NAD(P)-dependent dehydrogenase, short-chain alcohol dehydrogenase family [Microlunatus soli]